MQQITIHTTAILATPLFNNNDSMTVSSYRVLGEDFI